MILRNANTGLAHGLWLSSLNNMQISFLKQQDTTRSSIVKMKPVPVTFKRLLFRDFNYV